jgi:hypothetical protein
MLNKNDPLIGAVQEVMKKNQAERDAVRLVNEKFGVTDRKALPHERQGEWDAAYKTVLTEGVETLNELSPETLENYKDKRKTQVHATLRNMKDWQLKKTPQGASDFIINSAKKAAKHAKMIKLAGDKIDGKKGVVPANRPKKRLEEEELDEKKIKMYGIPNKVKPKRGPLGPKDKNAINVTNNLFWRMKELKKGNVQAAGNVTKAQIKKMQSEEALDEKLVGNQHRIDANKNGRVDGHDFKMLRAKKKPMEEDVTSPSSMGIKKPDYAPAGTTPDYAKSKEQTVNRAAKTSLPPGTMKESVFDKVKKKLEEKKVNPYAVGMAQAMKSTGDKPPLEKSTIMKAHKIAKKVEGKVNEGFNNRHSLSVNASVEEQAMTAGAVGLRQKKAADIQAGLAAQRQQSGDIASRPQSSVALQRQQSGNINTSLRTPPGQRTTTTAAQGKPGQSGSTTVAPRSTTAAQASTGKQIGGARPALVAKNTPTAPKKIASTGNPNAAGSGGNVGAANPVPTSSASVKAASPAAKPKPKRIGQTRYQRDADVTGPGGRLG